ncbi:hypothetical protein [Leptospira jelokensis]|uniref:hypothetical protein n=1 Tax=Leptospira jelokensis TaxID=2484931 RepID=UPI00109100F7|nr:hypothetical protein [Leptospira jelokensis]TGM02009.1 hypothetical protein EHQ79_11485 [Leptospira jelokensis]
MKSSHVQHIKYFLIRILLLWMGIGNISCNYLVIGSEFISGTEANKRVTSRILAKLNSCGSLNYTYNERDTNPDPWRRSLSTETNNALFLMVHLISRFEVFSMDYQYKSEDIDRCSKDIEYFNCDHFRARMVSESNFGIFVATLICKDVKKYKSPFADYFPKQDEENED